MNYNSTIKRGALQISGNDGYYVNLQFGCAQNTPDWQKITGPDLNNVGVYITAGNNMLVNVSGENADVSIHMVGTGFNRLVNCRADQCWGTGWIIESGNNMISNGLCENVSLEGTNLYDAFYTSGNGNLISNCWVRSIARFGAVKYPRYAFYDAVSASQVENRTRYSNCFGRGGMGEFSGVEYLGSPFTDKPIPNRSSDAAPDVTGTSLIVATGASLTGFTGSVWPGKRVTVFANATVTMTNNATSLRLAGNQSRTISNGQNATFVYYNGVWSEEGGWTSQAVYPSASAADIASATSVVNTRNKWPTRQVWDTTNNRVMVSTGSNATSAWYVVDGSASVTPA